MENSYGIRTGKRGIKTTTQLKGIGSIGKNVRELGRSKFRKLKSK